MEIPLEKFFQIFSHGRLAAFDGMANGALVHALLPGDLAVALAEDQMRLYPDALHLRQRVEGVPQVDEQLHTIYEQIYTPILRVNQAINNHVWHFRYYKDGSGKNDKVLGKFIEEIEALFIETTISEIDTNEKGDPVTMTSTKNKIVHTIQEELNEKYYQLMYGKKTYISSNQSLS